MGPFRWAAVSTVKMAFSPLRKGRKRATCMGERDGIVASKQVLISGEEVLLPYHLER